MILVFYLAGVSYFAAALAGFVISGSAANFRLLPPVGLSAVRYDWQGLWWPMGKILSILMRLLIALNLTALATIFFLLSSPLFALRFLNDLIGRPPPHGAMA